MLFRGGMVQVSSSDESPDMLGIVGRSSEGLSSEYDLHWSSISLSEDSSLLLLFIDEVASKSKTDLLCVVGSHQPVVSAY